MGDEREARAVSARKQLEREQERERSATAVTRAREARFRKAMEARRSKKPTPRPLADPARDERIFKAIKASLREGEAVALSARGGPSVTDYRVHKKRRQREPEEETAGLPPTKEERPHRFWTPNWDHAGDALKALSWGMVMEREKAQVFTAHISASVLGKAVGHPRGFARYMQDAISRHLRRRFSEAGLPTPEFFFSVEASSTVEPHLHGAIQIASDEATRTLAANAIRQACGVIPNVKQVEVKPMTYAIGWIGYMSKWRRGTQITLGDQNVVAATSDLRSAARRWYEEARRTGEVIRRP